MPPSPPPAAPSRDGRPSPTVSVIIPALNEAQSLALVLGGLPPVDEVIVVDGGSADDTVRVARAARPDALVPRQTRSGKGNALACGFAASTGDIVVTLNGDGSADPGEIPRYVDALLAGAEVAHGSRYRDGGADLGGGRWERLGNATLSRLVNLLFGTRCTDLGSGYNAYRRGCGRPWTCPGPRVPGLKRGRLAWGDGPEIEPLINIRMAVQGIRVVEVASVGYPSIHGDDREASVPPRLAGAAHALRRIPAQDHGSAAGRPRRATRRLPGGTGTNPHPGGPPGRYSEGALPRNGPPWPSRRRTDHREACPAGRREHRPGAPPADDQPAPGITRRPRRPHARRPPPWLSRPSGRRGPARWRAAARTAPRTSTIRSIVPGPTGRPGAAGSTKPVCTASTRPTPARTATARTDTGVRRVGTYDSGVHRTDVYESGVHHLPDEEDSPLYRQEVFRAQGFSAAGGGAWTPRTAGPIGRPDLTIISGDGDGDGDGEDDGDDGADRPSGASRRPGHLRAVPGERFTR